ncbi:uncharacterized protein LOC136064706 [Quercus suber]|uniref:uncharacterized protein LOC136064706 n=1 Tax=Quercus suber TaxID=58331 RepID=UPI0032DFBFC4
MADILRKGGSLQGEPHEGILWAKDDAFAQVMGAERHGRVRGVGLGPTPSGRSGSNLPCYTSTPLVSRETAHRITELETSHQTLRDELAQSKQTHQEQIAEMQAKHKEEIAEIREQNKQQIDEALAEAKRQSDAQHKIQIDEMMAGVRSMFDSMRSFPNASQLPVGSTASQ